MLFYRPLPFVEQFVDDLSQVLASHSSGKGLSTKQRDWLSYCMMGMIATNSVCWARFERSGLGGYRENALSRMFCHSPLDWFQMFHSSIRCVLNQYGLTEGVLVLDDTDHQRAKVTTRIHRAHKIFDKKTGGYFNGQCIVFLLLVTKDLTIPVGFAFYHPDPVLQHWNKEDKKLRKEGLKRSQRPPKPERDPKYPSKKQLSIQLTQEFMHEHPEFRVKAHLGDSWYSTGEYLDEVVGLIDGQVVSQLKYNQKVLFKGKKIGLEDFFKRYSPIQRTIAIRGGEKLSVWMGAARLFVHSHGKKRLVIALKYEEQEEYRYVVATDMSWRALDIVQLWTLRWLVEVFIEDFKSYEGWGQLAKQPGEEGSCRGMSLSLLLDHCLLLHPSQRARFENKIPAWTVGSLLRKSQAESIVELVRSVVSTNEEHEKLEILSQRVEELFVLQESKKHMVGRELGRQEPTDSLRYKNRNAA